MRQRRQPWVAIVLFSAGILSLRSDAAPSVAIHRNRLQHLPRLTVWAWERREDLRTLDPSTTAVAYLDHTITLDSYGLTVTSRRRSILLPASTTLVRIPVVRIETRDSPELNEAAAEVTSQAILRAFTPQAAALQIDFDALQSQRAWYRSVLTLVRAKLPAAIPLSITALASWCSYDNTWLHTLPVDEAVPMLFRMEPDRRAAASLGQLRSPELAIREPLCSTSVGISTHERWPIQLANKRIYIFPDAGWQQDNLKETLTQLW